MTSNQDTRHRKHFWRRLVIVVGLICLMLGAAVVGVNAWVANRLQAPLIAFDEFLQSYHSQHPDMASPQAYLDAHVAPDCANAVFESQLPDLKDAYDFILRLGSLRLDDQTSLHAWVSQPRSYSKLLEFVSDPSRTDVREAFLRESEAFERAFLEAAKRGVLYLCVKVEADSRLSYAYDLPIYTAPNASYDDYEYVTPLEAWMHICVLRASLLARRGEVNRGENLLLSIRTVLAPERQPTSRSELLARKLLQGYFRGLAYLCSDSSYVLEPSLADMIEDQIEHPRMGLRSLDNLLVNLAQERGIEIREQFQEQPFYGIELLLESTRNVSEFTVDILSADLWMAKWWAAYREKAQSSTYAEIMANAREQFWWNKEGVRSRAAFMVHAEESIGLRYLGIRLLAEQPGATRARIEDALRALPKTVGHAWAGDLLTFFYSSGEPGSETLALNPVDDSERELFKLDLSALKE